MKRIGLAVVALALSTGCGAKQWYRADLAATLRDDAPVSIELRPVTYWLEYWGDVRMGEASDPMAFTLVNKLPQPITVEWDRCAFVDDKGVSHRVIHSGVRLMSRDQPQVPSVVGANGRIEDLILPVDYVTMRDGRWVNLVYLPATPGAKGNRYTFILALTIDGKPVQLEVPIELVGVGRTS